MASTTQTHMRSTSTAIARGEGREAICRALARVVARDGFDGVTYRSVAAEAGVTHGLVSYHFKTRDAMIHDALKWAVEHTLEAAHLTASTSLEEFASNVPRALDDSPDEAVFQFELLLRALRSPDLREDVRKGTTRTTSSRFQVAHCRWHRRARSARLPPRSTVSPSSTSSTTNPAGTEDALSALRRLLAPLTATATV